MLATTECTEHTEQENIPCDSEFSVVKQNYDFLELIPAVEKSETEISRNISNCDRSVGTALSGWLVAPQPPNHPTTKLPNHLTVNFNGVAGQSFGAFLARGVTFNLVGEANDYIGKGISGGVAYVIDEAGDFDLKCNLDSIDLAGITENSDDEQELLALIREHAERTGSPLAARILADWSAYRPKFVKILPTGR